MDEASAWDLFAPMWSDIDEKDEFYNRKPLLAHYTSISSMEKILLSRELWFANPMYMNDHEEVGFGIDEGGAAVRASADIRAACGTPSRHAVLQKAFEGCYWSFARDHAIDTYVFCTSEHSKDDNDGVLSMWRGYGGNGSGAALVIDSGALHLLATSSFILARVQYGTAEQRRTWLANKVSEFARLLALQPIPDELLPVAATILFERIKLFSLFTKHTGFHEEKEWRAVYMPNRDHQGSMRQFFGYSIGAHLAEPRLKLPLHPVPGQTADDFSLEKIVDRIILGPTSSSQLAEIGFKRVLQATQCAAVIARVRASRIPFRHRL